MVSVAESSQHLLHQVTIKQSQQIKKGRPAKQHKKITDRMPSDWITDRLANISTALVSSVQSGLFLFLHHQLLTALLFQVEATKAQQQLLLVYQLRTMAPSGRLGDTPQFVIPNGPNGPIPQFAVPPPTQLEMNQEMRLGHYLNPEICEVKENLSGRYCNGYHVYFSDEMAADSTGRACKGFLVLKDARPGSMFDYQAEVAEGDYMDNLLERGRVTLYQCDEFVQVLFREPVVPSSSLVGDSHRNCFPCDYSHNTVRQIHAQLQFGDHGSPHFYHYTLLLFPAGTEISLFGNDMRPTPFYGTSDTGNHCHVIWRFGT